MSIQKLSDLEIKQFLATNPPPHSIKSDGDNLYLTIRPSGKPFWTYRYRVKCGEIIQDTTYTIGRYPDVTLANARNKLSELRNIVAQGYNISDYKRKSERLDSTFGFVLDVYLKRKCDNLKPNTQKSWDLFVKKVTHLRSKKICLFNNDFIKELLARLGGEKSSGANLVFRRLKQVLAFAYDEQYISVNETHRIRLGYKVGIRERSLTAPEIKKYFNSLFSDQTVRPIIKITIYSFLITLARREELLRLEWNDVDLDGGKIILKTTKHINNFPIIIPTQLHNILKRWRESNTEDRFVFNNRNSHYSGTAIYNALVDLAKKYNVEKFTPHDFRRTAMNNLAEMKDIDYTVIDMALMHIPKGVGKHYIKSHRLDRRAELLQTWADFIDTLLTDDNKPIGNLWL